MLTKVSIGQVRGRGIPVKADGLESEQRRGILLYFLTVKPQRSIGSQNTRLLQNVRLQ